MVQVSDDECQDTYNGIDSNGYRLGSGNRLAVYSIASRGNGCQFADVRLDNGLAYVWDGSDWDEICGHWFWNNNNGATAVCNRLGYSSGTWTRTNEHAPDGEAFNVGLCNSPSDFPNCFSQSNCNGGDAPTIRITCDGNSAITANSCGSTASVLAYQGCFENNGSNRVNGHIGDLTIEQCETRAREAGMAYFGMEYPQGFSANKAQCLVSSAISPTIVMNQVSDSDCDHERDSNNRRLGSGSRLAYYSVGA